MPLGESARAADSDFEEAFVDGFDVSGEGEVVEHVVQGRDMVSQERASVEG